MSNLSATTRAHVLRIVFYQLAIIVGFVLVTLLVAGSYKGLSILTGSMTYWLPTLIFMWRAAAHSGARAAKRFVIVFFTGEAVKLLTCGVLFVIAIQYLKTELFYTMMGLIGAIIAFWIASIWMIFQTKVKL